LLSSYAIFVAGNSSGVFTSIRMDSMGSFFKTEPDASEIQSFGAQTIYIVNGKVWVGGSIGMTGGGFCPLISKSDLDLVNEFAFTADCTGKTIFYSVDDFMFNHDPVTFSTMTQSHAIASARAANFNRVYHSKYLLITFYLNVADGNAGCSFMHAIEMEIDGSNYIIVFRRAVMRRGATD